ncbi:unnamed protein product [Closterium sp. NIES-54]
MPWIDDRLALFLGARCQIRLPHHPCSGGRYPLDVLHLLGAVRIRKDDGGGGGGGAPSHNHACIPSFIHPLLHNSYPIPMHTSLFPKEQGEEEEGESGESMTMGEKGDEEKEKNSTEEDEEGKDDGKEDEKEEEVYRTDKEEDGDREKKES